MIKKFVFVLLTAGSAVVAAAQHPIIEANKTWNVAQCTSLGDVCTTNCYKLGGTVEVDGQNYTELLFSVITKPTEWSSVGFLREDGTGKVFYRLNTSSGEVLLYDFSLTTGNVVELPSMGYGQCCSSTTTIDSVKTISYQGVDRKTLYVSSKNLNGQGDYGKAFSVWIEGVGSTFGLLQPTDCLYTGSYFYLLCSSVADQLIYQRSPTSSCTITSATNEDLQREVVVTTNAGSLVITNNSGEPVSVVLYTIDGKLQCNLAVLQGSSESISKSSLAAGICIVSVISKRVAFSEKVLIQ